MAIATMTLFQELMGAFDLPPNAVVEKKMRIVLLLSLLVFPLDVESFSSSKNWPSLHVKETCVIPSLFADSPPEQHRQLKCDVLAQSRRSLLANVGQQSVVAASIVSGFPVNARAVSSSAETQVTDRIFLDIKGIDMDQPPQRIVIGLFGKEAPDAVKTLKSLVTKEGLPALCKPKEVRTLQREQLEANKVYNACIEGQDRGVNYDLSTVWRVIRDERIDIGAVSGKYVSRQFPAWQGSNDLQHDAAGVVSVRKGNDSGFGFTIYPGNGDTSYLNANQLVVGRVLEGMDVVSSLNQVPVVTSSKLFPSQEFLQPAPSRSCRYGGNRLYCNEFKPLQKLSIVSTGVL